MVKSIFDLVYEDGASFVACQQNSHEFIIARLSSDQKFIDSHLF